MAEPLTLEALDRLDKASGFKPEPQRVKVESRPLTLERIDQLDAAAAADTQEQTAPGLTLDQRARELFIQDEGSPQRREGTLLALRNDADEIPARHRAAMALREGDRPGQINYLKSIYQDKNVKDFGGNAVIMNPDTGRVMVENREGFGVGDVAGQTGEIVKGVASGVGASIGAGSGAFSSLGLGTLPAAVGGAAIGGAGAEIALQAAGALLPGEETITAEQRASDVGTAGAIEGGMQAGTMGLGKLAKAASKIPAKKFLSEAAPGMADRIRRSKVLGTNLTLELITMGEKAQAMAAKFSKTGAVKALDAENATILREHIKAATSKSPILTRKSTHKAALIDDWLGTTAEKIKLTDFVKMMAPDSATYKELGQILGEESIQFRAFKEIGKGIEDVTRAGSKELTDKDLIADVIGRAVQQRLSHAAFAAGAAATSGAGVSGSALVGGTALILAPATKKLLKKIAEKAGYAGKDVFLDPKAASAYLNLTKGTTKLTLSKTNQVLTRLLAGIGSQERIAKEEKQRAAQRQSTGRRF